MSELMTVNETADFLRTTEKAVRGMILRGTLPGVVRLGRKVFIRSADLRRELGLLGNA